ncbi:glucosamine-6-phosphate deaminase [Poriferisphaera sp. WC338]|uniref:glucosamine-6-phosphate deaminase n=1 Tax=Poriferisphaera sp. WC338 TaxID=3425129 RepID=UPI003D812FC5
MNTHDPTTAMEKIPTKVRDDALDVSKEVAAQIAQLIRDKATAGMDAVLGLATGSTPKGVYRELIRLHQEENLSFKNVITFNLDEYYSMQPSDMQSYVRYMNEQLFDHIDIERKNVHVPDGTLKPEEVAAYCAEYEAKIDAAGGLDIQILGIGRTGHIGFNEPGSGIDSRTRMIWLDAITRQDAAGDFFKLDNVPHRAITMGVGTIMKAERLILMAFGVAKAPIIQKAIEGDVTSQVAASFLQEHDNAVIYLDRAAAGNLTRFDHPWLVDPTFQWDHNMIIKATIWLAQKLGKPLLKLTDDDYNMNHLQSLIAEYGPAFNINLKVFRHLQGTITGWPGGKPESKKQPGDREWPNDDIFPKRIVVFSPHPDDDVISMGGTLLRLCDQGHEVHVAYQVSGNIAVFDEDALRFADFARDFNVMFGLDTEKTKQLEDHVEQHLRHKPLGGIDSEEVRKIKGLIRRSEARAAGRYCGISSKRLHFLDLPFYETGTVNKNPVGPEDVKIIKDFLAELKPHQIYAAGDLADPHGTHRVCLNAIFEAVDQLKEESWYKNQCQFYMYRGAWHEWELESIDMCIPLSPRDVERKRQAIFKHESQKDSAVFPGSDPREFWQRAEERNAETAVLYDELGLAEYQAMEAFALYTGDRNFPTRVSKSQL